MSTATAVTMLDVRAGSGAITLPLTTQIPYRVITSTTAPSSAPTGLSSGKFWYFTVASSNASGVSSAAASSIVSY